ncbi:MAG: aspartate aminotransferase family protein [Desulfohalobiaceae bacterium]|nr:aspartate aminotransferase family protein [Desulfohalobiaceae bacterium]
MKRPGHVFHRKLSGELPIAVSGRDSHIFSEDQRSWLDASGGAVVVNVGHARAEIAAAVTAQLQKGFYFHPTMFTHPAVEKLAERLAGHAPKGISRFYFMSSGSEAVETALKLARQIHLSQSSNSKYKIISRWKSYHGLSIGALAATGRTPFRTPFAPMLPQSVHIPPPYCLRCPWGKSSSTCNLDCAQALEDTIQLEGPETVSCFLAETVSGATLAVYPPPPGYWPRIKEICEAHGVLLIQDEVMCGMGRTGAWFASEHYGVEPDILCIGKGLAGGAIPISAVGVKEKLYEAVVENSGFVHGGTFSHHPVGAAAGLATLDVLEKDRLVERVAKLGPVLETSLREALESLPWVADIRGLGYMWGIELVSNLENLQPFSREEQVTERIFEQCFEQGLIIYKSPGLGTKAGDGLVVAPPFTAGEEEFQLIGAHLAGAIKDICA